MIKKAGKGLLIVAPQGPVIIPFGFLNLFRISGFGFRI